MCGAVSGGSWLKGMFLVSRTDACSLRWPTSVAAERSRLERRLIFMGCLNALFAPFIVVYLLIYSFFRYFEVRICLAFMIWSAYLRPHERISDGDSNTTRTHHPLVREGIHHMPNGSFASTMNCRIYLNGEWIGAMCRRKSISTSFQRSGPRW